MTSYEKTSTQTKKKTYNQRDNESIHGKIRYRLRKQLESEGDSEVSDYVHKQYKMQELWTDKKLTDDEYAEISRRQLKALELSMKHTVQQFYNWKEDLEKEGKEQVKEFKNVP